MVELGERAIRRPLGQHAGAHVGGHRLWDVSRLPGTGPTRTGSSPTPWPRSTRPRTQRSAQIVRALLPGTDIVVFSPSGNGPEHEPRRPVCRDARGGPGGGAATTTKRPPAAPSGASAPPCRRASARRSPRAAQAGPLRDVCPARAERRGTGAAPGRFRFRATGRATSGSTCAAVNARGWSIRSRPTP